MVCVGKRPDKNTKPDRGEVPLYEPRLRVLIEEKVGFERISFPTNLQSIEMLNCAANALMALTINFINEVHAFCERPGRTSRKWHEAPALTIVPAMVGDAAKVRVVDPQDKREVEEPLPEEVLLDAPYNAANNAELSVILTERSEARALGFKKLAQKIWQRFTLLARRPLCQYRKSRHTGPTRRR